MIVMLSAALVDKKAKYKANWKTISLGIALFIGMMYLTTYAHEIGHSLVCKLSGYDYKIIIQPYTFETRMAICSDRPENTLLYWSMGGISGMLAAGVPLLLFRKKKIVVTSAIPFLVANALTGTMETFANDWYRNNPDIASTIASVPMIIIFCTLLIKYSFSKINFSASSVSEPRA